MYEDPRDQAAGERFGRRAALLFGLQLAVAGALGGRLYTLQVVEGAEHRAEAEENRVARRTVAPARGRLLDRAGRPLALNRPDYRVLLVREDVRDLEETIARLRRLAGLNSREVERLMQRLARSPAFTPALVKNDLDWDTFARLNANAPALPGVIVEEALARTYPNGAATAHVIGYVGAVTDADLEADLAEDGVRDPTLRLPEARIGKAGVERAVEPHLRGVAGSRRVEVNAVGREVRELSKDPAAAGDDVTLTLDKGLQAYAIERIGAQSGAAVVMDVETGDLLAMASTPTFDPNKFVFGISLADWRAYQANPDDPLRNKAAAGAYPPGSTWKMVTALAALEAGFDPRRRVRCTGAYPLGDRVFHCWRRRGHGNLRFRDALKESCDVYYYEAAQAAGARRLIDMARRFGAGEAPVLDLPNIAPGLLPTPEWKRSQRDRPWVGGDTLNVGIGQGALLMTPLQMAVMAARLANGRVKVSPRLVRAVGGAPVAAPAFEPLGVNPEHLALVKDAMEGATNERGGTAYRSRVVDPALAYAGKTGTAQVRGIGEAERAEGVRRNEDLPRELRDHALFVAYGPIADAKLAIAVVIEHGGSGSAAAAPVARDILMRALAGREPPLAAFPPEIRPTIEAERAERAAALNAGGPSGQDQDWNQDQDQDARAPSFWSPGEERGLG